MGAIKYPIWLAASVFFVICSIFFLANAFDASAIENGVHRIIVFKNGEGIGTGSGFKVAEPGYVVTNHHVVEQGDAFKIASMHDGEVVQETARLLWFSEDRDLAILEAVAKVSGPVVTLADISRELPVKSEQISAVGFPGVADTVAASLAASSPDRNLFSQSFLDASISTGTVQRMIPTVARLVIQHSANTNPGNSGGPIYDACARVVGVHFAGFADRIDANALREIRKGSNSVQIQTAGDIELAVHIRELLPILQDRNLDYTSRAGKCRNGIDQGELFTIGASSMLALLCAGMGFYRYNLRYHSPGDDYADGPDIPLDGSVTQTVAMANPNGHVGVEDALVLFHRDTGKSYPLPGLNTGYGNSERVEYVIGRSSRNADIVIAHKSLSRQHAIIGENNGVLAIRDLGSTNGTFVDGKRLEHSTPLTLDLDSVITFGDCVFDLSVSGAEGASAKAGTTIDNAVYLLSGFDQDGQIVRHTLKISGLLKSTDPFRVLCQVGRDEGNDLIIEDDSVSRKHAVIGVNGQGQLVIKDLGSSNGTFIDGKELSAGIHPVSGAQTIKFGETEITLTRQS